MDQETFWRLIGKVDCGALRAGDEEGAVEPLIDALAECGEAEVQGFANILAQTLYDLDGEVFADEAGESGTSGDGFLYARCFVVALGAEHFERVKADPSMMPKSLDEWCESLLYVAQRAWAQSTGHDEEAWDHSTPVSYETGSNRANWS